MSTYLVRQTFKGAINGIHVREYIMGERAVIDDPELVRVALENGYIEPIGGPAPRKARTAAPNTKGIA